MYNDASQLKARKYQKLQYAVAQVISLTHSLSVFLLFRRGKEKSCILAWSHNPVQSSAFRIPACSFNAAQPFPIPMAACSFAAAQPD